MTKIMDIKSFKNSITNNHPPKTISKLMQGLWYDGKGDWSKAHDIIDGLDTKGAEWAHAYLHRKEGDQWNADYWYRRAGRTRPNISLDEEWEEIVKWALEN